MYVAKNIFLFLSEGVMYLLTLMLYKRRVLSYGNVSQETFSRRESTVHLKLKNKFTLILAERALH